MDIVKSLKASGKNKWCDEEFGPRESDTYGSTALYFYDNDIPAGSPDPQEVMWLRPEEIVQKLIENGEE